MVHSIRKKIPAECSSSSDGKHRTRGVLLVDDNGTFCAGPRDKVNAILAVGRYESPHMGSSI